MSSARNTRLAWIAQELTKGKSNAMIVLDCMTAFPGVSESVARKDLKEILQRLTEIELECLPEVKQRMLEIGWKLMEDARSLAQMGPAVTLFKTLAQLSGLLSEKPSEASTTPNGAPESAVVRERIQALMRNKRLRAEAEALGVDLKTNK